MKGAKIWERNFFLCADRFHPGSDFDFIGSSTFLDRRVFFHAVGMMHGENDLSTVKGFAQKKEEVRNTNK